MRTKEDVYKLLRKIGLTEINSGGAVFNRTNVKDPYIGCNSFSYDQHRALIYMDYYTSNNKIQLKWYHIDLDDFENGSQCIDELYDLLTQFNKWFVYLVDATKENEELRMKEVYKEFEALEDFYE